MILTSRSDQIKKSLPLKESGLVTWQSPSNIALVKYWGKKPNQIPCNPSISLTLSHCHTQTTVAYKKSNSPAIRFFFDGKPNQQFAQRVRKYMTDISHFMPFLDQYEFEINSTNTFPHSSGIASSASSMSALALCLSDIERQIYDGLEIGPNFYNRASYLSRLGSGSACRSIFAKAALWGNMEIPESSDLYAIPMAESLHPAFQTMHDSVLIVSAIEKKVSSTAGHHLMNGNPYATIRYTRANEHITEMTTCLQKGDLDIFGEILEAEALELHALMMSSRPGYLLMHPNTLVIINKLQQYRSETKVPVYFTLDAGPNVHVLYPKSHLEEVQKFIQSELITYCHDSRKIDDQVGDGPSKLA